MIELWLKAFHIMAVISWMAGLFYLPRLFVYHTRFEPQSETAQTFAVMERKLLKIIMNPAMIVSWVLGISLAILQDQLVEGWFLIKFALVLLMSGFHMFLGQCRRNFELGNNCRSERFFRLVNEVPTVLMLFIVLLVVLKPL